MKSTKQKKLQLGKIKIADLNKANQAKRKGDICLTSIDDTSCPTFSRRNCE
jgi:hypothetical protein